MFNISIGYNYFDLNQSKQSWATYTELQLAYFSNL